MTESANDRDERYEVPVVRSKFESQIDIYNLSMDRDLIAYIPSRFDEIRKEREFYDYLSLAVVNMVKKVVLQVNKNIPHEDSDLSFRGSKIYNIDHVVITLVLGGYFIRYDFQNKTLNITYVGSISEYIEILDGKIKCANDGAHLFTTPEECIIDHKEKHIRSLQHIVNDIYNNTLTVGKNLSRQTIFPRPFSPKPYSSLNHRCYCDGVPRCTLTRPPDSPKYDNNTTLREVLSDRLHEIDLQDPFNKNSPVYFECRYAGLHNTTPAIRQVIESLTHHLFDMMERYRRLDSDLRCYPILLARKYCHTMLLSHRYGTSSLSHLPKDVLRYMLQYIWRTRYDVDTWFR